MEHCSRSHTVFYRALPLLFALSRAPTRHVGTAHAYHPPRMNRLFVLMRAWLASCKTLAKLQGLSGTAITNARQHGRASYDHSSDRSSDRNSGLNDANIDRFLLGLDGCGVPVSSTSGTQHCALRHAQAPVWKQIMDVSRHRPDVVPVTASASMAWSLYAIDATLPP